jgi:hypothetical protein
VRADACSRDSGRVRESENLSEGLSRKTGRSGLRRRGERFGAFERELLAFAGALLGVVSWEPLFAVRWCCVGLAEKVSVPRAGAALCRRSGVLCALVGRAARCRGLGVALCRGECVSVAVWCHQVGVWCCSASCRGAGV